MKQLSYILICVLALVATSCKKNEVSFTYKPAEPRAGQSVTFSNHTEEGEEWSWNFGDGSSSTSKSPSKIYKRPGTYTVTLKVDNKATRTYSTSITVHDTVPAIGISDTTIAYFEPVTLTAEVYNPYNYALSYGWQLPEGTIILKGDTASRSMTVCFTTPEADAFVSCALVQGDKTWHIDTTLYVVDTKASSLILGRAGHVLHQRIYKYGFEAPIEYPIASALITAPNSMNVYNSTLYIFNNDSHVGCGITRFDLDNKQAELLIGNAQDGEGQGFEYGYANGEGLFWATGSYVYKSAATKGSFVAGATSPMKVASADALSGQSLGGKTGGIVRYNGIYLYAYEQGIHLFREASGGAIQEEGCILSDQRVLRFALDPIAQKIYFVSANGLQVCLLDGSRIVMLDAEANGKSITVDNTDNLLFWTRDNGVYYMPLVQAANNNYSAEPTRLNDMTDIVSLAVDATKR